MNWIADYVVDDHANAAHPQSLVNKVNDLARFQMMNKEAATDQIETFVGEGKRERIAGYCGVSILIQVRMRAIEQGDLNFESRSAQSGAGEERHVSGAG